jgi:hypothetical protein
MQVIVNSCNTFDIYHSDLATYLNDIPYYSKKLMKHTGHYYVFLVNNVTLNAVFEMFIAIDVPF